MGEKDISEKILADHNDVFADIVNVLLFHGLKRVTPDALQNTGTTSHYKADDQKLHEQERDVMKAWTNGGIHIALIGMENQTQPEKRMPVRIYGYEGSSYRSQLNRETITPVVSLILYFGTEQRWRYPCNLKSVMQVPQELEQYVNDCLIHVFEIAWLPEEQIELFESDFGIIARYFSQKRKNKNYIPDDTQTIQHVDEVLKLLAVMNGDHRYEDILAQPGQKGKVKNMCDVAQRLEDKGRIEILISLCRSGDITIEVAAREMKITPEEFRKYMDD